jgi:hypothetical protein
MWSVILPTVGLPLVFTLVMTGIEGLARPAPFWEKMTDVGWDLCILGVGVTGGIFSNPAMAVAYGSVGALWTSIIVIGVNLGLSVSILYTKRGINPVTRKIGSICLGLGAMAVALPSGLTFWR